MTHNVDSRMSDDFSPIKESEYIIARALRAMFHQPGSDEHKEAMKDYIEYKKSGDLPKKPHEP